MPSKVFRLFLVLAAVAILLATSVVPVSAAGPYCHLDPASYPVRPIDRHDGFRLSSAARPYWCNRNGDCFYEATPTKITRVNMVTGERKPIPLPASKYVEAIGPSQYDQEVQDTESWAIDFTYPGAPELAGMDVGCNYLLWYLASMTQDFPLEGPRWSCGMRHNFDVYINGQRVTFEEPVGVTCFLGIRIHDHYDTPLSRAIQGGREFTIRLVPVGGNGAPHRHFQFILSEWSGKLEVDFYRPY